MKSKAALGIFCTVLVGMTICAESASADPCARGRVNNRQAKQQARMGQGISNGSLTKRETAKLSIQQKRLARREQRMRASGGGLTAKEHRRIENQQDNLSGNIYEEKHDGQER